jgi:hypothetical protein
MLSHSVRYDWPNKGAAIALMLLPAYVLLFAPSPKPQIAPPAEAQVALIPLTESIPQKNVMLDND